MDIDEAAKDLGIELLPWQRELGARFLAGEQVVFQGGRSAGRMMTWRVIRHAEGAPDA